MAQDPGAHPQLFIRNILSPEGRGFPSKGKFYFAVAEGREGIFWGSAVNEEQHSGKYKLPKIEGVVFPRALGLLTQIKTLLCWAKSWAKIYKNVKIRKIVANCSVPLSLTCLARLSWLTLITTLNFPHVIITSPVLFPLLPEALGSWTLFLFIFKWISSSQTSKRNFKMQMLRAN